MVTLSKKPGKQRLAQIRAPLHIRRKFLTAKLSKELRDKMGVKRLPVRKGDVVRIMRGEWSGHEGKVVAVDYEKVALHIDGVTIKKADGTPKYYPIHPSNVMIVRLDLSDKMRKKVIERRKGRIIEVTEEKPAPPPPAEGATGTASEEEQQIKKEESKAEEQVEEGSS